MAELLSNIASYHVFNFLVPGAAFSVLSERMGLIGISSDNVIEQLAWFYFVGLVVSRVGSLLLAPALMKMKLVKYSDYDKYLRAERSDSKIEVLLEASNMYRTVAAGFALLLFLSFCSWLAELVEVGDSLRDHLAVVLLLGVFLASFRKQSSYISDRVEENAEANR